MQTINQPGLFDQPAEPQRDPLELAREMIETYGDRLAIVVNHSGGKDSQRMLGYIRQHFPSVTTYVVYADTGFEHVKPVTAEEWTRRDAARYGLTLNVVRNPNKTYLEMVRARGKFPAPGQRQCTSDLKRGPVEKFIRNIPEKIVINCMGIRAAESTQRGKATPWKYSEEQSKAGRQVWNYLPIFRESLKDVLTWHRESRTPLHPVYVAEYHWNGTTGGYLRRFSCRVCIFSTPADLHAIFENDKDAFYDVARLESEINFTMRMDGQSLFQIIANGPPPATAPRYGSEEQPEPACMGY
jgi:DNA sulfur modification protein DndC